MSFWLRYTIYLLIFLGGVACGYFVARDSFWAWAGTASATLGYILWRNES